MKISYLDDPLCIWDSKKKSKESFFKSTGSEMKIKMRTFYLDIPNLHDWDEKSIKLMQALANTEDD